MSSIPPDWKDDPALWETLGKLPKSRASSNFTYLVRQKLDRPAPEAYETPWLQFLFPLRKWAVGLATVAAAIVIAMVWQPSHQGMKAANSMRNETVELAQLAQNYELIQDIEVIEHLDEL